MPQLVKKRRSGWAVLAVGALVASLVAVGAGPAPAAVIQAGEDNPAAPSKPSAFSACIGPALADRGFTDVAADNVHASAINCLAHYGITLGKGDGTFAPEENVTAFQMGLFMERAAREAGVSAEAVLGNVELSTPVTRAEMALLLQNLLLAGSGGTVFVSETTGAIEIEDLTAGEYDVFLDAQRTMPAHIVRATTILYETGVTTGTGEGDTFSPRDTVTRAEMASFITRTLGHTPLARPAGITAQADKGRVLVSVRDEMTRVPVRNAPVDAFMAASANADAVFNDNGTCSERVGQKVSDANAMKCVIDSNDRLTDRNGNIEFTDIPVGNAVWVWTGNLGDRFNLNSSSFFRVDVTDAKISTAPPVLAIVSSERPPNLHNRFGDVVTYDVQLMSAPIDHDGNPLTPDSPVPVGPDEDGEVFLVEVSFASDNAVLRGTTVSAERIEMDSNGQASFEVTYGDPDPSSRGQSVSATIQLAQVPAVPNDLSTISAEPRGPVFDADSSTYLDLSIAKQAGDLVYPTHNAMVLTFTDAGPVPTFASAEPRQAYRLVDNPDQPANHTVDVTVTDQFGGPIDGMPVYFLRALGPPDGNANQERQIGPHTTNADGTVGIGAPYSLTTAQTETLSYFPANLLWDNRNAATGVETDNHPPDDPPDLPTVTVDVVWAATGQNTTPTPATPGAAVVDVPVSGVVLHIDYESQVVVLDVVGGAPSVYAYDSTDQFAHSASDAAGVVTTTSLTFAGWVGTVQALEQTVANMDGATLQMVIGSYEKDNAADVASITVRCSGCGG